MQLPDVKFKWLESLSDVEREGWDSLARPLETPFLEWDWLQLMEISGSITAETGWIPRHLTVWSGRELWPPRRSISKSIARASSFSIMPGRKSPAGWQALLPQTGRHEPFHADDRYRFLMASGVDEPELTTRMIAEIERFCRQNGLAGCSYHFVDPTWAETMAAEASAHGLTRAFSGKRGLPHL